MKQNKKWVHYLLKNIPGDLHSQLKEYVEEEKLTMRQFMLDAIREKLEHDTNK